MRRKNSSPNLTHVLSVIGRLGPEAAQARLRNAQAMLYTARERGLNSKALTGAALVIREAGITLMKAAAELNALAREHQESIRDELTPRN